MLAADVLLEAAAELLAADESALDAELEAAVLAAAALAAPDNVPAYEDALAPPPTSMPAVIAAVSNTLTTCFFIPLFLPFIHIAEVSWRFTFISRLHDYHIIRHVQQKEDIFEMSPDFFCILFTNSGRDQQKTGQFWPKQNNAVKIVLLIFLISFDESAG